MSRKVLLLAFGRQNVDATHDFLSCEKQLMCGTELKQRNWLLKIYSQTQAQDLTQTR